jgi:hypothetical protein
MAQSDKNLEARVKELEAENKKLAAEKKRVEDAANRRIAEMATTSKSRTVVIPGEVSIKVENTDTGETETKKIGISDNHPWVSVEDGKRTNVPSEALMRVAGGGELNDQEKAKFPTLVKWGKEGAVKFLEGLFLKGSGYIKVIGMLLFLLVAFSFTAEAQIRAGQTFTFELDTLTDADAIIHLVNKDLNESEAYDLQVHCVVDSISGTTSVTGYIQETLYDGAEWTTTGTITITADSLTNSTYNKIISHSPVARQLRINWVSTGTQSTSVKSKMKFRRKEF